MTQRLDRLSFLLCKRTYQAVPINIEKSPACFGIHAEQKIIGAQLAKRSDHNPAPPRQTKEKKTAAVRKCFLPQNLSPGFRQMFFRVGRTEKQNNCFFTRKQKEPKTSIRIDEKHRFPCVHAPRGNLCFLLVS